MIPFASFAKLISQYLRSRRTKMSFLAALLISTTGLQLLNPQIMRAFLDKATSGAGTQQLAGLAVLFLAIALAHQGLAVIATYLAEDVGWSATNEFRQDLTAHVLGLGLEFYKVHAPGELIERVDADVTALSNFFSAFIVKVAANSALIVGILALLWLEDAWIGAALTTLVVLALGSMLAVERAAIQWWTTVRSRGADFSEFVAEQVDGLEDLKPNGAAPFVLQRFTEIIRRWRPARLKALGRGWSIVWGINTGLYVTGTVIIFWLGSILFHRGAITIGTIYLVLQYTELTRRPLEEIRTQIEDLQKSGSAIKRVNILLSQEPETRSVGRNALPPGSLGVEFDHVWFTYGDHSSSSEDVTGHALQDLTFQVHPGRVVGILGRTGSGKTTLARLLARLYEPTAGEIRFGGEAAHAIELMEVRRNVGLVLQNVDLFHASIRENLTFYGESVSDNQLRRVLADLGLESWLDSLPSGLGTVLQPGGGGLSAGQAQLLAFARVFLRQPRIVILDEASSRVDPQTSRLIQKAVRQLVMDRTAFIIAHRLTTLQGVDDILILKDGHVAEFGARSDLLEDSSSLFARLLETGIEEALA